MASSKTNIIVLNEKFYYMWIVILIFTVSPHCLTITALIMVTITWDNLTQYHHFHSYVISPFTSGTKPELSNYCCNHLHKCNNFVQCSSPHYHCSYYHMTPPLLLSLLPCQTVVTCSVLWYGKWQLCGNTQNRYNTFIVTCNVMVVIHL